MRRSIAIVLLAAALFVPVQLNPAKVREPLRCVAEIESVKRKVIYVRATAFKADGSVVARAASKMVITRNENE